MEHWPERIDEAGGLVSALSNITLATEASRTALCQFIMTMYCY